MIIKRYGVWRLRDDRLVATFDRLDALLAYLRGLPRLEYRALDTQTGEEIRQD